MICEVKVKGLQVIVSVVIMNLVYEDDVIFIFDFNFKVLLFLWSVIDWAVLKVGVFDGIIDIIVFNY